MAIYGSINQRVGDHCTTQLIRMIAKASRNKRAAINKLLIAALLFLSVAKR